MFWYVLISITTKFFSPVSAKRRGTFIVCAYYTVVVKGNVGKGHNCPVMQCPVLYIDMRVCVCVCVCMCACVTKMSVNSVRVSWTYTIYSTFLRTVTLRFTYITCCDHSVRLKNTARTILIQRFWKNPLRSYNLLNVTGFILCTSAWGVKCH